MSIERADTVRSVRGRDKSEVFYVLTVEDEYAFIVNGRDRRLEKPKKKKLKHIEFLRRAGDRVSQKLLSGEKVTNSEIRRALAAEQQLHEGQGGMHFGEGRRD